MNLEFLFNLGFNIQAIVGAVLIWIFSWLWHDHIIVKPWLRWTGMTIEEASALHEGRLNLDLGLYLISKIVLSYSFLILLMLIEPNGIYEYIALGAIVSFGIIFSSGVGPVIFENRNVGLWMLSSALSTLSVYLLITFQYIAVEVLSLH